VPAVADLMGELQRIRDLPVTDAELRAARDFLVGVFPLRFETPGPVVGALSGLLIHELPEDELIRYRPAIEAVDRDAVAAAARDHLRLEQAAIVLVGDIDAFGADLEAAGFGLIVVERDEGPTLDAPIEGVEDELGPVDDELGPTEGAEEPNADGGEHPADADTGSDAVDQR
jgi:hypothetical protein